MVIGIFGESCTGKTTLAEAITAVVACEVYSGKDYLRLAKNENVARILFQKKLQDAVYGENIIYVISEKEHLSFLPEGALRIHMTAQLDTIKSRFAKRMRGTLPVPVATMLERKHGCFDNEFCELRIQAEEFSVDDAVDWIRENIQTNKGRE